MNKFILKYYFTNEQFKQKPNVIYNIKIRFQIQYKIQKFAFKKGRNQSTQLIQCFQKGVVKNNIKIRSELEMTQIKLLSGIVVLYLCIHLSVSQFNASICGYIQHQELFYFINQARSDTNIMQSVRYNDVDYTWVYNYCHQLQYWCQKHNKIIVGSLIAIDSKGDCYSFLQNHLELINPENHSSGVKVTYHFDSEMSSVPSPVNLSQIYKQYPCNQNRSVGCPQVSRTTMWTYFSNNSIGYTITIQIIGVLFMVLGVYMYRITLVILGSATAFIVLLAIEQNVVFIPGVPQENLSNVMLITLICSFFFGYVMAYFPKAGLFCMGMWIGLIVSLTLNNVALYLIYSTPENLPLFIVLPVLCIGFGILTVCVKRKFIIFATSLIGAYVCLRALSWHLGAFPNQFLYPQQYQLGIRGIVVWQFYLYVVALLILTASSSALQFWLFKKKIEKSNESGDIDEHFDKMQNKLENQRQNIIEFQNIFKKLMPQQKHPRVLKRDDSNDEYEIEGHKGNSYKQSQMSFQDSQDKSQVSPQRKQNLTRNSFLRQIRSAIDITSYSLGYSQPYLRQISTVQQFIRGTSSDNMLFIK